MNNKEILANAPRNATHYSEFIEDSPDDVFVLCRYCYEFNIQFIDSHCEYFYNSWLMCNIDEGELIELGANAMDLIAGKQIYNLRSLDDIRRMVEAGMEQ